MRLLPILFIMSSFLMGYSQEWQTDFEEATTLAARDHRNIVLVFQGSDWCAPCMKLEKEIWESSEFKSYAEAHFILLKADFPRKKKNQLSTSQQERNNRLAEKYNQEGYFPLVVILNPDGEVLGKTGYKEVTPGEYINLLENLETS
ncbi:MAG: thioredoxin family protein [Saprospiraceae bacterium]|nr:thioredoxin family protein [Saprospiraceae bacterium]